MWFPVCGFMIAFMVSDTSTKQQSGLLHLAIFLAIVPFYTFWRYSKIKSVQVDEQYLYVSIYCGEWTGSSCGIIGHIVGFVLGAIAALTFLFSFFYFLDFVLNLCQPNFPICKNGKCSRRHYTYIESLDNSRAGAIFSCKCKTKYIMKREKGLHFKKALELFDNGTTQPYKKYVRRFIIFGHWEDDSEEPKTSDSTGTLRTETDL